MTDRSGSTRSLFVALIGGVVATSALATASVCAASPGWTGVALKPLGWTGLGLYAGAWAAYRPSTAKAPPADPAAPPAPGGPTKDKPWIWERLEFPLIQTDLGPGYRSYIALKEIDCIQGAVTPMQWTTYADNNLAGDIATDHPDPGKKAFIVPGSLDDVLRQKACR